MKKILFFCLILFLTIEFIKAERIESVDLPYYVKFNYANKEEIMNVKKIYNGDVLNVLFSIKHVYGEGDGFKKYTEFDKNIWDSNLTKLNTFNTIVYYGYLKDPNDFNYYLTQMMVWKHVFGYDVEFVDKDGNKKTEYEDSYNKIFKAYMSHNIYSNFFYETYEIPIWTSIDLFYNRKAVILDNPKIDDVTLINDGLKLTVYGNKVGSNRINLFKKYDHSNVCFSNGDSIYWQNLGGPIDIEKYFDVIVTGVKVTINEVLKGPKGRVGDAKVYSNYEVYLNDELKITTNGLNEFYVKDHEDYVIKDESKVFGVEEIEDKNISVIDEEVLINIERNVISKEITVNIFDNQKYYIYLKSNNELYEVLDKESSVVKLPYGTYNLTNNNGYELEIKVLDSETETINLNNKEDIPEKIPDGFFDIEKETVEDNISLDKKEEIDVKKEETVVVKEEVLANEVIKENVAETEEVYIEIPQTGIFDHGTYIWLFVLFGLLMLLIVKRI